MRPYMNKSHALHAFANSSGAAAKPAKKAAKGKPAAGKKAAAKKPAAKKKR